MKNLFKSVFLLILSLYSSASIAGVRQYNLEFATLNPADLTERDTRSPSTTFTALGNISINDDNQTVSRNLTLCILADCVTKIENFSITGYSEGTNAVLLLDQLDQTNVRMTFVWNYQNLGFMETLAPKWGTFAGQKLSISWKDNNGNTSGNTGGGSGGSTDGGNTGGTGGSTSAGNVSGTGYRIMSVHVQTCSTPPGAVGIQCITAIYTNTSTKTQNPYVEYILYKNGIQTGITNQKLNSVAAGASAQLDMPLVYDYDTYVFSRVVL